MSQVACDYWIFAGGSEPRLVAAATEQLKTLPFYHSFWNRTTKPSLVLFYLPRIKLLKIIAIRCPDMKVQL